MTPMTTFSVTPEGKKQPVFISPAHVRSENKRFFSSKVDSYMI